MKKLIGEYGMLPPGTKVLCAVSGGADSLCLLHRLWRLRPELGIDLAAAHYNHCLRGEEADRDEELVREFVKMCCGRQEHCPDGKGGFRTFEDVELYVDRGDVAAEAERLGQGLEETGREMRYAFLQKVARGVGAQVIATAHTANDNAETVMLHLVRGTGLRGLAGIAPVRGNVIRPLLTTSRVEVEEYLRYYGLPHAEDSSNLDDAFTRNRLRHGVIPELESICPGFMDRVTQMTELLRADEEYLSCQAKLLSDQAMHWGGELTISAKLLAQAPEPIAARAVRQMIGALTEGNDNCSAAHLKAVTALCRGEDPSARADLPNGLKARREYDMLVLSRKVAKSLGEPLELAMPGRVRAGDYFVDCWPVEYEGERQDAFTFYLDREKVPRLLLRARATGDRLRCPGRPEKSLKKWLIDEKIPQHLRDGLPVLECDGQVAAAAAIGPDMAFVPQKGQEAWKVTIIPAAEEGDKGKEEN